MIKLHVQILLGEVQKCIIGWGDIVIQSLKNFCSIWINQGFWSGRAFSSGGKELAYNAGDPSLIPGSGRSPGEGLGYSLQYSLGFPGGSAGKESTYNSGDLGSIPGLGRSPGEGKSYPLQYSGLENSNCAVMGLWRVGNNWVTFAFTFHFHFSDQGGTEETDLVGKLTRQHEIKSR